MKQYKHENINDVKTMTPYDFNAKLINSLRENSWSFTLAIPLEKLPERKDKSGYTANFIRSRKSEKSAMWSPYMELGGYLSGIEAFGELCFSSFPIQEARFTLLAKRENREFIKDDTASDKKAAKILPDGTRWMVRYRVPATVNGKYRVYVDMRTEIKPVKGLTTSVGVYDKTKKRIATFKKVEVSEISGKEYKTIEVCEVELTPDKLSGGMYIYVGGFNKNVAGRKPVYIDRFVLKKID